MAPPANPNPHRFLPLRRDEASKRKDTSPSSGNGQFVPTPKFFIPAARARLDEDGESSQPSRNQGVILGSNRLYLLKEDGIVDSTPSEGDPDEESHQREINYPDDDDEMLLGPSSPSPTEEHQSKRQRRGSPEVSGLQDRTFVLPSKTPGSSIRPNQSLWTFSRAAAEDDDDDSPPVVNKNSFITPESLGNQPTSDPLPAVFSPHRKSQKFLPTGLAASMRSHIMNLSPNQYPSGLKSHVFKVLEIQTSRSPEISRVKGMTSEKEQVNIILAGPGPGARPEIEDLLTIHGINWPVEILEEQWIVCVDWKVNR